MGVNGMNRKSSFTWLAAIALGAVVTGCGPDPVASASDLPSGTAPAQAPFTPNADAGIKVEPGDPVELLKVAQLSSVPARPNPFSLRSKEVAFDRSQFAAGALANLGGWYQTIAEEPVPVEQVAPEEPQPPRRLAGILIGETITALIDMGDGGPLQVIHPGQELKVGATTWIVQSIDEEKAVLRRANGNARPKYVVVRLEDSSSMGGGGGGGGNPGGNPGGGPPSGNPGGAGTQGGAAGAD